jgi:hypothetical protein
MGGWMDGCMDKWMEGGRESMKEEWKEEQIYAYRKGRMEGRKFDERQTCLYL